MQDPLRREKGKAWICLCLSSRDIHVKLLIIKGSAGMLDMRGAGSQGAKVFVFHLASNDT